MGGTKGAALPQTTVHLLKPSFPSHRPAQTRSVYDVTDFLAGKALGESPDARRCAEKRNADPPILPRPSHNHTRPPWRQEDPPQGLWKG